VARVATRVLAVALAFGPGLVYAGVADPYVSPPPEVFGAVDALVVTVVGFALLLAVRPARRLRRRYWRASATDVGLDATGGAFLGATTFEGTVRGRNVRASIGQNGAFESGDHGRTATNYVVVEAALDRTPDAGVVLGPSEQHDAFAAYDVATTPDAAADGLVAVADRDGLADTVLTSAVDDRLHAVNDPSQVYAGDATAAADALPDDDRRPYETSPGVTTQVDAAHDDALVGGDWLGGPRWVSHVDRTILVDADALQARLDAVVAVADALDDATR
jgi:hypothetical protein